MGDDSRSMAEQPGDTLISHGLDFVLDAVTRLNDHAGEEREARYAVVHLAMGAELLHKGRLFRHDRMQVFQDPAAGTEAKLLSGDFFSVRPEKCIERLESMCAITFTTDEKGAYERLRQLRNKVVHFAMPMGEEALRAGAAEVLAVLVDFIDQHADIALGSAEAELRDQIYAGLANIEDWISKRLKAIGPEVHKSEPNVFGCPVCDQLALVVQDGERRCLFCFSEPSADEAALSHAREALGFHPYEGITQGWDPFRRCPLCEEEEVVVRVSDDEKETESKCFACGKRFDDEHTADCMRCGRLFIPAYEEDDVTCPDCFDDVVSGD
jgi:hypothetical protein